jgi:hypothetical protein
VTHAPRLWLALVLAIPVAPASTAAEDPDLDTGVRQVEEGYFEGAIVTLEPVAQRLAPAGGPDAVQAFLYLGIAQLALGQRDLAHQSFLRVLELDPGLVLSPDQHSPKVRSALDAARQERPAAVEPAGEPPAAAKKGGSGRTLLLAGAGVAAGVGIAFAVSGGDSPSTPESPGEVQFAGARFSPASVECPNGAVDLPIEVDLEIDATNTGSSVTLSAVSSTLVIVASPAVPGEIGFASSAPTTSTPSVVPGGMTTLRLQTTLRCSNGTNDDPRYNEWSGRVVLATALGAENLETVNLLRVNIP